MKRAKTLKMAKKDKFWIFYFSFVLRHLFVLSSITDFFLVDTMIATNDLYNTAVSMPMISIFVSIAAVSIPIFISIFVSIPVVPIGTFVSIRVSKCLVCGDWSQYQH
jgi:hypothetical protein